MIFNYSQTCPKSQRRIPGSQLPPLSVAHAPLCTCGLKNIEPSRRKCEGYLEPTIPVDEWRLPSRVVPDQHDGDFLSGRQQLQPKGLRDRYQAMLRVGVQCMALLEGEPGLKGRANVGQLYLENSFIQSGGGCLKGVGRIGWPPRLHFPWHPRQRSARILSFYLLNESAGASTQRQQEICLKTEHSDWITIKALLSSEEWSQGEPMTDDLGPPRRSVRLHRQEVLDFVPCHFRDDIWPRTGSRQQCAG